MTSGARDRLLRAAIDYVSVNGLTDLSLRRLATELGTSHRMLSHHFGSKDGLWVAIVEEVERRQLRATVEAAPLGQPSFADAMRTRWLHVSDPSLWPIERLFFEVYAQALHRRSATSGFLDGVVESWLGPVTEIGEAIGLSHEDARAFARLGVAVTRGLLLDLLATGDRDGVDAAMEQWIESAARTIDERRRVGSPRTGGAPTIDDGPPP
jgi:AcrR family transcriptional regulator